MWCDSNDFASRYITVRGDTTLTAIFAPIASLRDTIYDTVYVHDTITIYDTIVIHDTIVVGVDGINGRVLATKQDYDMPLSFAVPATGTYMIKIGQYPARRVVVVR